MMQRQSLKYSEVTKEVRVTVLPEYMPHNSEPERKVFAFAYTVTIQNEGERTLQLMRRHWYVSSGGALYTEVEGEGVVGEKPVLHPGDSFSYTSGSVIKDPVGSMHGTYTFVSHDGALFEAIIPRFDLIYPELVH